MLEIGFLFSYKYSVIFVIPLYLSYWIEEKKYFKNFANISDIKYDIVEVILFTELSLKSRSKLNVTDKFQAILTQIVSSWPTTWLLGNILFLNSAFWNQV